MSGKPKAERDSEIVREAVKRVNDAISYDKHNREPALDDLRMKVGDKDAHWSDGKTNFRKQREDDGRVCLVVNRLPGLSDQVSGDLKANMPSCKVHPADKLATVKLADKLEDRIRAIEADSDAESIYDEAGQQIIDTGFGNFRIVTEFAENDIPDNSQKLDARVFRQVAKIKAIHNQFAVIWDHLAQEYDKSDAEWCAVLARVGKDTYKKKYKGRAAKSFETARASENWYIADTYTVCEYFRRENAESKTLYMLPVEEDRLAQAVFNDDIPFEVQNIWEGMKEKGHQPGQVLFEIPEELQEYWKDLLKLKLVRERKIQRRKIVRYLLSGHEVLEGPQEWLSDTYFPIIPLIGKATNVDGKVYTEGVLRQAKDSQKAYSFGWSTNIEEVAMTPKTPAYVTPEQIRGFESTWQNAHKTILPFLPYNPDPMAPGPPVKPPQAQASTAITEINSRAIDDMRAITNVFDPAMQQVNPDMSGRAVMARVSRSSVANYAYIYNLARSRMLAWRVLLDIIPKIETTTQDVTMMAADGTSRTETINQPNPEYEFDQSQPQYLNDFKVGKYDVTVSIGPSYATQRMEAAENLTKILQFLPEQMRVVLVDFVIQNFDYHGIPEVVDRIRVWQAKNGMGYLLEPDQLKMAMEKLMKAPQQPPPPLMIAKLKELAGKAIKASADAELQMAKVGEIRANTGQKMMQLWQQLGYMVMMGMQGEPQQPGQGQQGQLPAPMPNQGKVM